VASSIGDGTSDQWEHCETIKAEDAQPGDLVFQAGPENGSNNHVGILAGQTDDGDWIAVHCSSSQNGVTVGEAYSASFRYIRCPSIYPTEEEVVVQREESEQKIVETSLSLTGTTKTATSKKKQSNSLLDDVSAAKDSGSSSLALEN
jgi:hypothetical protein